MQNLTAKDVRELNKKGMSPQDIAKFTGYNLINIYNVLMNKFASLEANQENFSEWSKRVSIKLTREKIASNIDKIMKKNSNLKKKNKSEIVPHPKLKVVVKTNGKIIGAQG